MGNHGVRAGLWPVVAVCLLVVGISGIGPGSGAVSARRQADEGGAGDAPRGFRAVSERELTLTVDGEMVWQATELPVLAEGARPIPFRDGFLVAHDGPLVVFAEGGDDFTRVADGKAVAIERGERLTPTSLLGEDALFLALELASDEGADDPVGDAFAPGRGEFALELWRVDLGVDDPDEPTDGIVASAELDSGELPALLLVLAGQVEPTIADDQDGEPVDTLETGDAISTVGIVGLEPVGEANATVLAVTLRATDATGSRETAGATGSGPSGGAVRSGATGGGGGTGSRVGASTATATAVATATPGPTSTPKEESRVKIPGPTPTPEAPAPPPVGGGTGGSTTLETGVLITTSLCLADTDGDGIGDFCEASYGTSPTDEDTDGDGLKDGYEVDEYGSNPTLKDTDSDGVDDSSELFFGTGVTTADSDGDGLVDGDELRFGTAPLDPDSDDDGLPDGDEIRLGADPHFGDSDGDCLTDAEEFYTVGSSPANLDTDGDGWFDGTEWTRGFAVLDANYHPDEGRNGFC